MILKILITVAASVFMAGVVGWIIRECVRDTKKLLREIRKEKNHG